MDSTLSLPGWPGRYQRAVPLQHRQAQQIDDPADLRKPAVGVGRMEQFQPRSWEKVLKPYSPCTLPMPELFTPPKDSLPCVRWAPAVSDIPPVSFDSAIRILSVNT